MCIRDRLGRAWPLPIHLGLTLVFAGLVLLVLSFLREDLDACLLYTSDAADERSSVDLGGRRIIKKKTIPRPTDDPEQRHRTVVSGTTRAHI